jgi:hypothetical protein
MDLEPVTSSLRCRCPSLGPLPTFAVCHRANLWSLKNKPGCQRGPRMPLAPMTQSPAAPSSVCWRSCTHLGHRNPVPAGNATTPLRRLAHRISAYCDAHPFTLGGETTHHVAHFFLELRIVGKIKLFDAMGLNVMTLPEAVYHHARNPQVPS